MTTHVWPTVPRFGELDPYGHVNHAVYISYFEAARCVALADVGMSLPDLAEADTQIIVSQIRVRFRAPAGAGDALRVETEVAEVKRASSVWAQRIVRAAPAAAPGPDAETVLVEALVTAAVCDNSGRPRRPPPGLMEALAGLTPSSSSPPSSP